MIVWFNTYVNVWADAELFKSGGRWFSTCYLSGYVVECYGKILIENYSATATVNLRHGMRNINREVQGISQTIGTTVAKYLKNFPAGEEDLKDALHKCGVIAGEEETVIDQLKDIGVFKPYQKKKGDPVRYHIPDIYLFGMGLVRKGPGW